jgi:assimilatory nitrate reductase catalytic subunit
MSNTTVATHCPYCALQCAQSLTPAGAGVSVEGRDFPTNRGGMCQKGWTSGSLLTAADRLTTPLVRRPGGELEPVTWEVALDLVALRLNEIRASAGPDAVAVFGGGGLTNEKAYQLGKFARVALGTANIDYNGRFCMSSAAAAANRSLGIDRGLPFPLTDLAGAQVVLLLGSNLAETMPPAVTHLSGVRSRGGLVVVDPRRSATAALAEHDQGLHLQPVPGTDLVVLLALLHIVLAEGLADIDYLETRTTGLEEVRRSAALWWPERAEQVCGVPASALRATARLLAEASPAGGGTGAYILTGRGVEQSTQARLGSALSPLGHRSRDQPYRRVRGGHGRARSDLRAGVLRDRPDQLRHCARDRDRVVPVRAPADRSLDRSTFLRYRHQLRGHRCEGAARRAASDDEHAVRVV